MKEMIKLECEQCGQSFERPAIYEKYIVDKPLITTWKWKLKYCDKCFDKKVQNALKRMPEILDILSKEEKKNDTGN